ncbi:MAG: ZIP family metal transporter [Pseudomonadota bacterium]
MIGEHGIAGGIIASGVGAAISAAGILTLMLIGVRAHRLSAYFSAFAVGFLLPAVLFHLLPEAIDHSEDAWQWAAAGFVFMAIAGMGIQLYFMSEPDGDAMTFGYASIVALTMHSLLDGAIYAASFQGEPFTGILSVAGLLLHEFPEGIIAYLLLREAGLKGPTAGIGAFFAAGLSTVAGAIGGYWTIDTLNEPPPSMLYGAASGAIIYVVLRHLIPHAARTPKQRGYLIAAAGVTVSTAAIILSHFTGGGHHHH